MDGQTLAGTKNDRQRQSARVGQNSVAKLIEGRQNRTVVPDRTMEVRLDKLSCH